MKLNEEIKSAMNQRFGKDSLIALATVENGFPYVRTVDAYYENGSFYVITYLLSNKMRQIGKCDSVAISGDWFTAQGKAINLGYFCKPENAYIATKLKQAFAAWIDNGHNDFDDPNTVILEVKLVSGVLFANNMRYDVSFAE